MDVNRWCFGNIGTPHEGKWIAAKDLLTSGYPMFAAFNDIGGLYVCKNCNKKLRWVKKTELDSPLRR